jgi:hypothetical protein
LFSWNKTKTLFDAGRRKNDTSIFFNAAFYDFDSVLPFGTTLGHVLDTGYYSELVHAVKDDLLEPYHTVRDVRADPFAFGINYPSSLEHWIINNDLEGNRGYLEEPVLVDGRPPNGGTRYVVLGSMMPSDFSTTPTTNGDAYNLV